MLPLALAILVPPAQALATNELPLGTLAVVNKVDNTLHLVDLPTKKRVHQFATGPNPQEVVFVDGGRTVLATNMGHGARQPGNTITIGDADRGTLTGEINLGTHGAPHGLTRLDADRVLVTSHATDHILVVNWRTKSVERAFPSGGKGTHLVLVSPDGKRAYAANVASNSVTVLDLAEGKLVKSIPAGNRSEGISLSQDGRTIAIGNLGDNSVTIIDTEKLEPTRTIPNLKTPIRTFFSSDGKRLFVSCAEPGEIAVISTGNYQEETRIILKEVPGLTPRQAPVPIPMNFDRYPDRPLIFTALINCEAVLVWDERTLKPVAILPTGPLPDGIAVRPTQGSRG